MARAEPAPKVSRLSDGHTTEVRADTDHDEPLRLLRPGLIALGVAHRLPVLAARLADLVLRSVTHEDGLSAPFDNGVFALGDVGELDLDLSEGKDIGRRAHGPEELRDGRFRDGGGKDTHGADHEIGESTVGRRGRGLVPLE